MEKYLVTLTGPDNIYQEKKNLKVGTSVRFHQDANNNNSNNAVKVTLANNELLGYVGETSDFRRKTHTAKELFDSFGQSDYITGIVLENLGMALGCTNYLVEVNLNPMTNTPASPSNSDDKHVYVEMDVKGARTIYKAMSDLVTDITMGESNFEKVKVIAKNENLVLLHKKGEAGALRLTNSEYLMSFDGKNFVPNLNEKTMDMEMLFKIIDAYTKDNVEFEALVSYHAEAKSLVAHVKIPQHIREDALLRFGVGEFLNRVIDKKILSYEAATERLQYMQENGFDEDLIKRTFGTMVKYEGDAARLIPNRPKADFVGKELLYDAVFYAVIQKNLIFEGAKGTGKNHLSEQLAWLLNRPLLEVSLNANADNASLLGTKTIDYDEQNRQIIEFVKEPLIKGAEIGAIVVLDEMNTAIASVMSVANSLLDKRRRISVPGYKFVEAHNNFCTIATLNPSYQGTMDLNEATAERFIPILFDAEVDIEGIIKNHYPKVTARNLKHIKLVFEGMQKLVLDNHIDVKTLTIRGMQDAAESTLYGKKLSSALITCVANRAIEPEERKAIRNLIKDTVGE